MSYFNLIQALMSVRRCEDFEANTGASDKTIAAAERILGITFSAQCKTFYKAFNYVSFYGCELYGIFPDALEGDLVGNSVAYTLHDRKHMGLPAAWIPFQDLDDGSMAYFDYSHKSKSGEPRIIAAHHNGDTFVVDEVLANDFGAYFLKLVKEAL